MQECDTIIRIVLEHYPNVQGIYLFGTYLTQDEWPGSDVDIAILLPPPEAERELHLAMSQCWLDLVQCLRKQVDLVNSRQVSTVFQKEIIAKGRLIYSADQYAVDEFEMLVLSYYQKLNEERREILNAFMVTGRAYAV